MVSKASDQDAPVPRHPTMTATATVTVTGTVAGTAIIPVTVLLKKFDSAKSIPKNNFDTSYNLKVLR